MGKKKSPPPKASPPPPLQSLSSISPPFSLPSRATMTIEPLSPDPAKSELAMGRSVVAGPIPATSMVDPSDPGSSKPGCHVKVLPSISEARSISSLPEPLAGGSSQPLPVSDSAIASGNSSPVAAEGQAKPKWISTTGAGSDGEPQVKAPMASIQPTTILHDVARLDFSAQEGGSNSAQVNGLEAQVNGSAAPVNGSESDPVNSSAAPVNGSAAPVNGSESAPVIGSATQFNGSAAPINGSEAPVSGYMASVAGSGPLRSSSPQNSSKTDKPNYPILGAWSKPLNALATGTTTCSADPIVSASASIWPALTSEKPRKKDSRDRLKNMEKSSVSTTSQLDPELLAFSKDFPWAAKMDQSLCNLHRVTTPEFLPDGTPMVKIPRHVLLEGLENQKEYIVGQFMRCSAPSGGLIHAIMSKIWGRRCKIFTRKLSDTSYLFHIPDEPTRNWVLQRGMWHVDDCLMFVSAWSPTAQIALPEIKTLPVWLTLKNIPIQLYSIHGIKWISSGIGEPMLTSKPRLDPSNMGEAKILVELKLDRPFPQRVAVVDDSGLMTMVEVSYSWLPSKCATCGHLGHKSSRCLGILTSQQSAKDTEGEKVSNGTPKSPQANSKTTVDLKITEKTQESPDSQTKVTSSPIPIQLVTADDATIPIVCEPFTASEATKSLPLTIMSDKLNSVSPKADTIARPIDTTTNTSSTSFVLGPNFVDGGGVEENDSSSEDSIDEIGELEETLQRKSTRNSKPTQKAKEMQRSATKGKRGRGRRGRGHR